MLRRIVRGLKLLGRHKKAVVLLYLANLGTAAILALPLMHLLDESLGAGLYRQKLLESLDYDWLTVFQERAVGYATAFDPSVLGAGPFFQHIEALLEGRILKLPWELVALGGLYAVLNAFLLGAALGSFALDPAGASLREFFRTGGTFFGRFFRISLLGLLCYALLTASLGGLFARAADLFTQGARTEMPFLAASVVPYALLLPVFMAANMVFDYTRLKTAQEDRTSVLLAFFSAFFFCLRRPATTFGLYLLLALVGLMGIFLYVSIEAVWPAGTRASILLFFLFQQAFIVGRLSLRLLFHASQLQVLVEEQSFDRTVRASCVKGARGCSGE